MARPAPNVKKISHIQPNNQALFVGDVRMDFNMEKLLQFSKKYASYIEALLWISFGLGFIYSGFWLISLFVILFMFFEMICIGLWFISDKRS